MIDFYYWFDTFDEHLRENLSTNRMFNEWCQENCSHYFIFDILGKGIRCSFTDETDAMGFKLKWL